MSTKPIVAIEASCLLPWPGRFPSGIGRSLLDLVRTFEAMADLPIQPALFAQRFSSDRLQRYGFESSVCYLPLPRWQAFLQMRRLLPIMETMTGASISHIQNFAPVFRPDRTIATIHDAMFLTCPEPWHHKSDEYRIIPLARKLPAILTASEHSKKELVEAGGLNPDRIHVTPLGYDPSMFYREHCSEDVRAALAEKLGVTRSYFLAVSCDIGRKNTPELVRAFLRFAERCEEHDLVVLWRSWPDKLSKEVNDHPQCHRIHRVSGVPDAMLRTLYSGALALMFPSRYEGFGLPILEAMACGCPVVTGMNTSLPEVGGDAPHYIDANSVAEIEQALFDCAEGKLDLAAMRSKGLARATQFSWKDYAKKTIGVYERIL